MGGWRGGRAGRKGPVFKLVFHRPPPPALPLAYLSGTLPSAYGSMSTLGAIRTNLNSLRCVLAERRGRGAEIFKSAALAWAGEGVGQPKAGWLHSDFENQMRRAAALATRPSYWGRSRHRPKRHGCPELSALPTPGWQKNCACDRRRLTSLHRTLISVPFAPPFLLSPFAPPP